MTARAETRTWLSPMERKAWDALDAVRGSWVSLDLLALALYGADDYDDRRAACQVVWRMRRGPCPEIELSERGSGLGYRLPAGGQSQEGQTWP